MALQLIEPINALDRIGPNAGQLFDAHQQAMSDLAFQAQQRQALQAQQAVAARQQQAALTQAQRVQAAREAYVTSPSAVTANALFTLDPTSHEAVKAGFDGLQAEQQKTQLQDWTAVYGNLKAGRADAAVAVIQRHRDADAAAGHDTSGDDDAIAAIKGDPTKAKGLVESKLLGVLGPDKFVSAFGKFGEESRANAKLPGEVALTTAEVATKNAGLPYVAPKAAADLAKTQAETKQITDPRPETSAVPGAFNPDGSPVFYNKNAAPPVALAGGASPELTSFVTKLQASENSTGDPGAKNPLSSATGNGQFVNKTWLQIVGQVRPDLVQGKSPTEILALRSDPQLSAQVTAAYAQQNATALSGAGLPVNGATLAAAHKLGPGGAKTVLTSDTRAPLASVLSAEVMKANPQLKGQTVQTYLTGLASTFGATPVNTQPADPNATGDDYLATLNPAHARLVKAIANGDAAMPTGRSAATGAGQALMQQVLQYDPTASSINLEARKKTREAFTSGTEGRAINSANTVVGHLVALDHSIDALGNSPLGIYNKPAEILAGAVGDPQVQKSRADFNFYKTAVANELTKVFRGSNGAEADVQGWLRQLDSAKSPVALHATVRSMVDGMRSRLEALGAQYSAGMGKTVEGITLLTPHSQKLLAALETGAEPGVSPTPTQVQALRQNPERAADFDAKFGQGAARRAMRGM